MPKLQGCGFSVLCDDQALPEYSIEEAWSSSTNTTTCWIPSEAGKRFKFEWSIDEGSPLWSPTKRLHCFIDGMAVRDLVRYEGQKSGTVDGALAGDTRSIRPFLFSELTLTEDDHLGLPNTATSEHIGSIYIKVYRAELVETSNNISGFVDSAKYKAGTLHEKSKKAGAHCVSFGPVESVPTVSLVTVKDIDREPYITFKFHYRSRDMLQAMGIIPPPDSPAHPQPERPEPSRKGKKREREATQNTQTKRPRVDGDQTIKQDEDEDDENTLQEQMRALQQRMNAVRASRRNGGPGRVKREVSPIRGQFPPGEIIDLT